MKAYSMSQNKKKRQMGAQRLALSGHQAQRIFEFFIRDIRTIRHSKDARSGVKRSEGLPVRQLGAKNFLYFHLRIKLAAERLYSQRRKDLFVRQAGAKKI